MPRNYGESSGRESHPSKPPAEFPDLMTLPCPRGEEFPDISYKEGDDLLKVMQSKEFLTWEHAHEKYECWITKSDWAVELIHSAIEYTQHETITGIKGSKNIWEILPKKFCGEKRHWQPKCPRSSKTNSVGRANLTLLPHDDNFCEVGKLLMAVDDGMLAGLLLDSATSCHMVAEWVFFTSYKKEPLFLRCW